MKIIESYELKQFESIIPFKDLSLSDKEKDNMYLFEKESGLMATASMLIYMSKTNAEYREFFTENLNLENYREFVLSLKKYVKMTPFGIFTAYQMNSCIRRFTKSKGKRMHLMKSYWKWNIDSVFEYIKSGLFSGTPVLMMTWNSKKTELKNRWIYVIGLRKYDNGNIEITAINKSDKKVYDLKEWTKDKSLYKGLIYYK